MIKGQVLNLSKTKELIFTAAFVGLAVYVPYLIHYFDGINMGRTFLPMHFFVLTAGLLLGWRAGLAVGLASPVISYLIAGMPAINVLPFIVIEMAGYGLVAGMLRQKYNIFISLLGTLVAGRLLVGMAIFLFSDMSAVNYVLGALKAGWQGIALQIIFVPVVVKWLQHYFNGPSLFQREVRRDY